MSSKIINKTYNFYCEDLNFNKYDLLKKKAEVLREFKNNISNSICENHKYYFEKSKFDWINIFRTKLDYCNNQDISHAISDVYVNYDNKRRAYNKNTQITIQKNIKVTYYKKNINKHKKGDIKDFKIEFKSTNLTKVVSYLTKYYDDILIEYITNNKSTDDKVNQFRELVLYYIDKYGDRLINLVIQKQNRIKTKLFTHPIEFISLTFNSLAEQKQNIINKNPRTSSKYNCYISLPGQKTQDGKIHIPVKYNKFYHGKLKEYYKSPSKNGQIKYSYTICFEQNRIRIILSRPVKEKIITRKYKYYGVDVNVKHNLFCDKNGNEIDFDRKLINKYVKFLKYLDNKKSNKQKYNQGDGINKKDQNKYNKLITVITDDLKRKSSTLVSNCVGLKNNHIVLEDLGTFGKSFSRLDYYEGFKTSRLVKMLNLSEVKNIITSIANKKGVQVSLIQSAYTSITCLDCGNIDKRNRKTQEEFKCICCGSTSNADTHSSKCIEERLEVDVLRKSLLNYKSGEYTPKNLKRSSIKNILEICYDNNITYSSEKII